MKSVRADKSKVDRSLRLLAALKQQVPEQITRSSYGPQFAVVLASLKRELEASLAGVPQEVRRQPVAGPSGTWRISRFSAHRQLWVGVQWPSTAPDPLIKWFTSRAFGLYLAHRLASENVQNQLWIMVGTDSD